MFKKLLTGAVAGAMFLTSAAPMFATYYPKPKYKKPTTKVVVTNVVQTNTTTAGVGVNQVGNTGGNEVEKNVSFHGGTNSVETGNVTNTATVVVAGGNNTANVPLCGCPEPTEVVVGGGCGSHNQVSVSSFTSTNVVQSSTTVAQVSVNQVGNTGGNEVEKNVGGTNTVDTGNVENTATVIVTGGSNTLN